VLRKGISGGGFPTSFLNRVSYAPSAFEVIEPGLQTTVQDYPGRVGFGMSACRLDRWTLWRCLANHWLEARSGRMECTDRPDHEFIPLMPLLERKHIRDAGQQARPILAGLDSRRLRLRLGAAAGPGARLSPFVAVSAWRMPGGRSTFILSRFGDKRDACCRQVHVAL
jgi:hypothetical protein